MERAQGLLGVGGGRLGDSGRSGARSLDQPQNPRLPGGASQQMGSGTRFGTQGVVDSLQPSVQQKHVKPTCPGPVYLPPTLQGSQGFPGEPSARAAITTKSIVFRCFY